MAPQNVPRDISVLTLGNKVVLSALTAAAARAILTFHLL